MLLMSCRPHRIRYMFVPVFVLHYKLTICNIHCYPVPSTQVHFSLTHLFLFSSHYCECVYYQRKLMGNMYYVYSYNANIFYKSLIGFVVAFPNVFMCVLVFTMSPELNVYSIEYLFFAFSLF